MRKVILLAAMIMVVTAVFAQVKVASKEDIDKFLKSKTYIVYEENPFSGFNAWVEDGMAAIWKVTPFEIIDAEQFDQKMSDPTASFIFISQARFSKTKTSLFSAGTDLFDNSDAYNYTIINLVMGDKSKNINNMPELCIVPVSYSEVEPESYEYKYGALLCFIQFYINYTLKNEGKDIQQMVKDNGPELKNYELWFVKEELSSEVNTVEKIKALYPHPVKIVTAEDIESAIYQRNSKVAFLHKIGPEGTAAGDSRCWKFIMTAAEGKPLYFETVKINSSSPDAFTAEDFKNMANK